MTDLCDPAAVRRLLEENGLAPRKAFGQNFLINPAIPAEIAEVSAAAPFFWEENRTEGTCALEIGPGLGALTRELAARYAAVTAVEIDRGLIPVLAGTLADCPNAEIVEADFMKTDVPALLSRFGGKPVHVAGNLPYYITTPILMRLLESYPADGSSPIRRLTLMVQKEVADRL
jgi:16S rRNA (adenine1518-N6/adenine1519-N6)-dimethyltransferase